MEFRHFWEAPYYYLPREPTGARPVFPGEKPKHITEVLNLISALVPARYIPKRLCYIHYLHPPLRRGGTGWGWRLNIANFGRFLSGARDGSWMGVCVLTWYDIICKYFSCSNLRRMWAKWGTLVDTDFITYTPSENYSAHIHTTASNTPNHTLKIKKKNWNMSPDL